MKRCHSYNSDLNYSLSDEPIKIAITLTVIFYISYYYYDNLILMF